MKNCFPISMSSPAEKETTNWGAAFKDHEPCITGEGAIGVRPYCQGSSLRQTNGNRECTDEKKPCREFPCRVHQGCQFCGATPGSARLLSPPASGVSQMQETVTSPDHHPHPQNTDLLLRLHHRHDSLLHRRVVHHHRRQPSLVALR